MINTRIKICNTSRRSKTRIIWRPLTPLRLPTTAPDQKLKLQNNKKIVTALHEMPKSKASTSQTKTCLCQIHRCNWHIKRAEQVMGPTSWELCSAQTSSCPKDKTHHLTTQLWSKSRTMPVESLMKIWKIHFRKSLRTTLVNVSNIRAAHAISRNPQSNNSSRPSNKKLSTPTWPIETQKCNSRTTWNPSKSLIFRSRRSSLRSPLTMPISLFSNWFHQSRIPKKWSMIITKMAVRQIYKKTIKTIKTIRGSSLLTKYHSPNYSHRRSAASFLRVPPQACWTLRWIRKPLIFLWSSKTPPWSSHLLPNH